MIKYLITFLLAVTGIISNAQTMATNPIINADVPDIAIVRVGNTYYMSSTTMHMNPGVPVMKSTDLVNWEMVNYCYATLASTDGLNLNNGKQEYGHGSWASSIRYANSMYYVSTFSSSTGKTYIYKTANIEGGTWTVSVLNAAYHDCNLFFDDDGRVYLIYGQGDIKIIELTADASAIKSGGTNKTLITNAGAVAGPIGLNAEGSQVLKHNGYYYINNICWPSGGMRTQIVHRSSTLTGTYESKVILKDQGVAQGSFIETPAGKWYAYLFKDGGSRGRVPYLIPMTWTNDWPVLSAVPATLDIPLGTGGMHNIVASDEFSQTAPLKLAWQWNHNPQNNYWSLAQKSGYLRLTNERTDPNVLMTTNTLTQRTFGPQCSGYTSLDVSGMKDGDYAGLIALQKQYGYVGVKMSGTTKSIVMVNGNDVTGTPAQVAAIPLNQSIVYLRIDMDYRNQTDKAYFYYSLNGTTWQSIGSTLQMSYTIPQFIGYRYGLFTYASNSAGGYADFDFFRIGATISTAMATNNPPTVALTSPVTGTKFNAPATITLSAAAADADGTVSTVQFYNGTTLLNSDASSPYTYSWTNVSPGTYTITAVATDNSGNKTTSSAVTITVVPLATITAAGATTFCTGGSVTLNANTGTGYSYVWKNGTATIAGATTSSYTATASGSYTVNVSANSQTTTSSATVVTVNTLPVITPYVQIDGGTWNQVSTATVCAGSTIVLGPQPTVTTGWSWTGPNGYSASTREITLSSVTASQAGVYTASYTDGNTCKSSSTFTLTVNALPTAPTVTTAVSYCQNATPTPLTAIGTNLTWYTVAMNGTGAVTAPTPTTGTAGTTNYYVSQSTNGCESARSLIAVTVNALPTAAITTTTPTTFCHGGSVVLTASSGSSYKWMNGVTAITGATAQTYTATAAGSYTVEVTNANSCKATSAEATVTVNALPNAPSVLTPVTYCENASASALTANGNLLKWYAVATDEITLANAPIPITTVTGTTNYYVSQTSNGCESARSQIAVTVNTLPAATITANGSTNICQGSAVALTASAGSSYVWKNGSSVVGSDQTYNATTSGSYLVEVSNSFNCKATSSITTVMVNTATTWYADTDGDGMGDPVVTQSSCSKPTGYVSTAGDGCPADADKTAAGSCGCGNTENSCLDCAGVPNGTAAIDVCNRCSGGTTGITPVTDIAGCMTTATTNQSSVDAIKILPNPSCDQFTLLLNDIATVYIFTVEGRLVEVFENVDTLNFGSVYAKGMYVVQVNTASGTHVLRVIKQ